MKSSKAIILALIVMALWGSLFPSVKIGYRVLHIDSGSVPDILMFACVCGAGGTIIFTLLFAFCTEKAAKWRLDNKIYAGYNRLNGCSAAL